MNGHLIEHVEDFNYFDSTISNSLKPDYSIHTYIFTGVTHYYNQTVNLSSLVVHGTWDVALMNRRNRGVGGTKNLHHDDSSYHDKLLF